MNPKYLVAALLLVAWMVGGALADDHPVWWHASQPQVDDQGYITIYGISPSGHTVQDETVEMYQGPSIHEMFAIDYHFGWWKAYPPQFRHYVSGSLGHGGGR